MVKKSKKVKAEWKQKPAAIAEISSPYTIDEENLRERLYYHHYGRICPQLYLGLLGCISGVSFGTALGLGSPIMHYTAAYDADSPLQVAIVPLGCAFGVPCATWLLKHSGPLRLLRIHTVCILVAWALMFTKHATTVIFARFALGLFGVSTQMCARCHNESVLHYRFNRSIVELIKAARVAGIFIVQFAAHSLPTHLVLTLCVALPLVHLLALTTLYESPVWLYAVCIARAESSLTWYRGKGNIHLEMMLIRRNYERARLEEKYYMLYSKAVLKAQSIILILTILEASSGYYIFILYGIVFFHKEPIFSHVHDVVLLFVCFFVSKMTWAFVHSRFALRARPILITSCVSVTLSLFTIGGYYLADDYDLIETEVGYDLFPYWTPCMLIGLIAFFYDMGLNFYPEVISLAYIPFEVSKVSYSMRLTVLWICIFLNTYLFGIWKPYISVYNTFFLYALLALAGAIYVAIEVVEITGASLMQIQLAMGCNPVGSRGVTLKWLHEQQVHREANSSNLNVEGMV